MKRIIKLLFALALVLFNAQLAASPAVDFVTQITAAIGSVALATALIVPYSYTRHFGQLNEITNVSVFSDYIVEKIRETYEWLSKSRDRSKNVLQGVVVYIRQAGNDPTVLKNNRTWPLTPQRRADGDVSYVLDDYSLVPDHIPWIELQGIGYNKLDSVIGNEAKALITAYAMDMLRKWAPTSAAKIVKTTGAAISPVGSQTGNRKGLSEKDVMQLMFRANHDMISNDGQRLLIVQDNMFDFLYESMTEKQSNYFNQFADEKTGRLGKLHSFNIYTGSSLAFAGNNPTPFGSELAATDDLACVAWHPDFVERAIGETKLFYDKDNPMWQGDISSSIVRAGGRKIRADEKGVYAIVQDKA